MSEAPFCRDCLTPAADLLASRCKACGSPRLLRHKERDALAIAHVDCDAFFAAVEKRDDPGLADKPVIVGGRKRGVVATACYIARTYGVHSAMPMFRALEACPDAVVVRPDMEKYARVGREVRALRPPRGGRPRHHGLDRAGAQQVPGQDRLGSREAAGLLGDRPGGGAGLPRPPPGRDPARHRAG